MRRLVRFARSPRAVSALETAIAVSTLAFIFGLLISLVVRIFEIDSVERATRALARGLAVDETLDACSTATVELGLPSGSDCPSDWAVDIDLGLSPADLPDTPATDFDPSSDLPTTGAGGLVLVRVRWPAPAIVPGTASTTTYASASVRAEP